MSINLYRLLISLSIIIFIILGICFIYTIPPFENSDETGHFGYIMHLANEKKFPVVDKKQYYHCKQEGYQQPVYYLSCVPAAWLMQTDRDLQIPYRNPLFFWSPVSPGTGEHRMFLPITKTSSAEQQQTACLCTRLRFISLLWALGAVVFGLLFLQEISKDSRELVVIAFALFVLNPRWIETAASITNDGAAVCMAIIILYLIVLMIRKNMFKSFFWVTCLSLVAGCSVLTKMNCMGLAGISFIVLCVQQDYSRKNISKSLIRIGLFIAVFSLLALPWFLRNQILYHDFMLLKTSLWKPFVAWRKTPMGILAFFREEFQGFRWSFWAVFGQFGVLAHRFVYVLLDHFMLIGGVLGSIFLVKRFRKASTGKERFIVILPLLWISILFISFLRFNRYLYASQGRLLYPAGFCLSFYVAGGLLALFPKKVHKIIACLVVLVMIVFALYVELFVLIPSYYPPGFALLQ